VYLPGAGTVPDIGSLTLSVTFTPTDTANYTTATASVTLTVMATNTLITWAAPGAITYGTALSTAQLNATSSLAGTFVYTPSAGTVLSAGSHILSVTFTPTDTSYSATVATVTLTVIQATPTLTWTAPSAIPYGTALNATQLSASSNAAGTFSYSPSLGAVLSAGTQSLLVVFTPTDSINFIPTAKTVQLTVNKATPVVAVTASPAFQFQANPVTFNAALNSAGAGGPPSGSVTFYDGATALGTSALANGGASFATSSLGLGAHSITAAYGGDSNYVAATSSSAVTETIGTMTIASTGSGGSTINSSPSGQAVFTLSFTPPNGQTFPQAIQLSVSGLPSGASATFNPTSIPAGSGATNVTLTVSVPSSASVQPLTDPFGRASLPIALALVLLPFATRYRKAGRKLHRASRALLTAVAAIAITYALVLGVSGCGGSGGSSSTGGGGGTTSPRTYALTLTASSGTYAQTTSLTLVVK
jgi:hypothetical protein